MKPLLTVAAAVLAVPVLASTAHAAGPAATNGLDRAAKVSINRTPNALQPMGTSVNVTVTYTCKNTRRTTHYLSGQVTQPDTARYVIGYRGDYGGTLAATCTGKPVTQRLAFQRSAYHLYYANQTLQRGSAELTFTVEARGTFGSGAGWYDVVGPGATVVKTVAIPYVH